MKTIPTALRPSLLKRILSLFQPGVVPHIIEMEPVACLECPEGSTLVFYHEGVLRSREELEPLTQQLEKCAGLKGCHFVVLAGGVTLSAVLLRERIALTKVPGKPV